MMSTSLHLAQDGASELLTERLTFRAAVRLRRMSQNTRIMTTSAMTPMHTGPHLRSELTGGQESQYAQDRQQNVTRSSTRW